MVANVDVWIIDIDRCAGAIQTCWIEAVAAHGERAIAPVDPASPSKATIEHAVRLLLARDIGLRAALHPFERSPSGKPAPAARSIHFSISDTGGLAAVAVARGGPVGVDIEAPRMIRIAHNRRRHLEAWAEVLSGGVSLPAPDVPERRFLQAWVRLEAAAKATGEGIGAVLERARAMPAPGSRQDVVADTPRIWILDLDLSAESLFGAIATTFPDATPAVRALPDTAAGLAAHLRSRH